ncbi:MAG TPA: sugar phosphate isomerase/epimerase [bacterium]|nr:sugar phosphate isomerase/epimerase [bacterium]
MKTVLGMPTLVELHDLQANATMASELGLDFVEMNLDCPAYLPERLPAEVVRQIGEESGLAFTVHLPEKLDLAVFQSKIRRGQLDFLAEVLHWTAEAGIELVNMHLNEGVYFTLPDRRLWLYEAYREDFLSSLMESFRELSQLASRNRTRLCIENLGRQNPTSRQALKSLLQLQGVYLTYDVGHDAEADFCFLAFVEEHAERLAHMHLHDFDGRSSHQTLFSGTVNIPRMIALAQRLNLRVVVETKTVASLRESVRRLHTSL